MSASRVTSHETGRLASTAFAERTARDPAASDAHRASPATVLKALMRPLLHRMSLGEGGLLGMTTWVAAWHSRDVATTAVVFAVTWVLLASLYLYNDVSDRVVDALNPNKVARHRELLLAHPRRFFAVAIVVHAAAAVAAWRLLGAHAGASAASLLVLNPLYSGLLKRVPLLDVAVVGAMGAAVVGVATSDGSLLAMAAAMTAISHGFQTRVDAKPDRAAGIRSSGAAPARLRNVIWVLLAGAFAVTVYVHLGPIWAASAVVPYVLLLASREANRAWGRARVYFAIVWIAATIVP